MLKQIARLSLLIATIIAFSCNSKGTAETSKSDKSAVDTSFYIIRTDTCNVDQLKASGYVNDFTGLFTPEQKLVLDSIMSNHEKQTSNQIAIATVDSSTVGRCSIVDFARALGTEWGVGQKEKNNGTMIVICKSIHRIGIANGTGIKLSDAETKSIIDDVIIPEFRKDNYFEGIRKGLLAIIEKIKP